MSVLKLFIRVVSAQFALEFILPVDILILKIDPVGAKRLSILVISPSAKFFNLSKTPAN